MGCAEPEKSNSAQPRLQGFGQLLQHRCIGQWQPHRRLTRGGVAFDMDRWRGVAGCGRAAAAGQALQQGCTSLQNRGPGVVCRCCPGGSNGCAGLAGWVGRRAVAYWWRHLRVWLIVWQRNCRIRLGGWGACGARCYCICWYWCQCANVGSRRCWGMGLRLIQVRLVRMGLAHVA